MIFLVNDANILIDLLKVELLDSFFQMHCTFYVTDFVLGEIQEDNAALLHRFLDNGKLMKQDFSFEELVQTQTMETRFPALSIPDCSCLFLCNRLSATLLTGDAALRGIARQNEIAVHGILWVFDEMVEHRLISKREAIEKLIRIIELNPRLPSLSAGKESADGRSSYDRCLYGS
jgi:hypothetical protein